MAELLPVGKAKIANLGFKDANECLWQGKAADAIIEAIFQATDYRPDGILAATDYRDAIGVDDEASSITYPLFAAERVTRGLRKGELVTLRPGPVWETDTGA